MIKSEDYGGAKLIFRTLYLLLFIVTSFSVLNSLSVGSDSAPSRQNSVTFLEADSDNEMNGFGAIENGFTLESISTTCTFDSFFPISGAVDMRAASLYLLKDIAFDSGVSLTNMGSIYGNGHAVRFSESVTTAIAFVPTTGNPSSFEQKDLATLGQIAYSLDWTWDDNYVAVTKSTSGFIEVHSFDGTTLTDIDGESTVKTPNSLRCHPSAYYFAIGTIAAIPKKRDTSI